MTLQGEQTSRNPRLLCRLCLIVAMTVVAYLPALKGGFIWDDDRYVTNNPLLTAPDGFRRIWFSFESPSQYFPLTYTSFKIEHALWGVRPFGYHFTNVLLHAANAVLLWRLLARLNIPGAWLAAGIFALHPVQVESVAWITERKNVLMGLFFLVALLAWVEFVNEQTRRRWNFYAAGLVVYALALFSKATACTLPAVLVLILWFQKRLINRERLLQIAPFVLLGLLMGLLVTWWERYHQGTSGTGFAIGIRERLLIASHAVWFYAGKLVWPSKLTFSYPRWNIAPDDPLAYGWLVALLCAGAAIYFARRNLGRAPEVAVGFFIATLSPLLGLIMNYTFRYSFVADHYQYLASIGLIALFAAALSSLASKRLTVGRLKVAFVALLFLLLGGLTWHQARIYHDLDTLWTDTVAKNPGSWMAHHNFGDELLRKGQVDEAMIHFQQSLAIKPDHAEAEHDLGNALLRKGQVDEAMIHFQQSLAIKPNLAEAEDDLGNALLSKGRGDDAIAHFRKALEIRPGYASAHNNLGNALLLRGELNESIAHYLKAIQIQPDLAVTHNNLGIAYESEGKVDEATRHYRKALELKPDYAEAHYNLAGALLELGQRDEAVAHLIESLRIKPDYMKAKRALEKLGMAKSE
jgi:protein O-mannosyl-transferase